MEELDNYSIETDHTVLLSFRNGRQRRVKVDRLQQYLMPQDLHIVQRAMKLRQDFIRSHMPKAVALLVAAGLLTLLAVNGRTLVARLLGRPDAPGRTNIVRNQILPEPGAQPAPASPATTPRISRSGPAAKPGFKLVSQHMATTAVISATAPVATPQPPAPSVSPTPSPAASPAAAPQPLPAAIPSVQPAATPTPSVVEQGQVLGDSTGP